MMKNWKIMLCLLMLLIPSLGRGEIRVQLREQDLPGVHLAFFVAEGEDNEAGEVEAINLMLDAFFRQQEAVRMAQRGCSFRETPLLWQREGLVSMGLVWTGDLPDGERGSWAQSFTYDLNKGTPLSFTDLFEESAKPAIEKLMTEQVAPEMDAYLLTDLLPLPETTFVLGQQGITFLYPENQLRAMEDGCGQVHLAWYEVRDAIREEGPIAALAGESVPDREQLLACVREGRLPGLSVSLGQAAKDAFSLCPVLPDADFTKATELFSFAAAQLRGFWAEVPRYALDESGEVLVALGTRRMDFFGLVTGFATREDVVSLLGEPAGTRTLDAKAAAAEMLESGESLIYEEGHLLEMHFNEAGTLSAVILRTAMPEDLYR